MSAGSVMVSLSIPAMRVLLKCSSYLIILMKVSQGGGALLCPMKDIATRIGQLRMTASCRVWNSVEDCVLFDGRDCEEMPTNKALANFGLI